MNKQHITDRIQDYIDGELSAAEARIVREHLAECAECSRELAAMTSLVEQLRALPRERELPAGFIDESDAALRDTMAGERRNGHVAPVPARTAKIFRPQFRWYYAAAAMVLLAGISLLVYNPFRTQQHDIAGNFPSSHSEFTPGTPGDETTTTAAKPVSPQQSEGLRYQHRATAGGGGAHMNTTAKDKATDDAAPSEADRAVEPPVTASEPVVVLNEAGQAKATARAGHGVIKGRVTNESGMPVIGANVLVTGTTRGAVTDPDGRYVITNLVPGRYTLKISSIGYNSITLKEVVLDSVLQHDFALTMTPFSPDMAVRAERGLVNSAPKSAQGAPSVSEMSIPSQANDNSPAMHGGGATGIPASAGQNTLSAKHSAYRLQEATGLTQGDARYFRDKDIYSRPPRDENNEEYKNYNENPFLDAGSNPLSTFSIDVDAASYTNLRRFLNNGQRPPADAVRIEEMINYFNYSYPQPRNSRPFSVTTDLAECPWAPGHSLLLVGLQGKKIAPSELPPSNLTFLIDVSGSMNEENKLPLVKAAFRLLVQQLRSQDRVAIVVYAGNAGLVLPSTPGTEKEQILRAIDGLEAGGSTAGGAGIQLAYSIAKENFIQHGNNRVILATDGDFNVGVSSEGELERLIEARRNEGVFLTVLGFGVGNYKDNKMQVLADKGNGNNYYIDNLQEAQRVFIGQMAGTLFTIAKDVKIQIEFNPANVKAYRLIGYEKRILNKEDFNDDRKDAGELGVGHTVTALYEIVPIGGDVPTPTVDPLKYQKAPKVAEPDRGGEYHDELLFVKLRYKEPRGETSQLMTTTVKNSRPGSIDHASENLRFAAGVAEFGMALKQSQYKENSTFTGARRLVGSAKGDDPEGYRGELLRLIDAAKNLYAGGDGE